MKLILITPPTYFVEEDKIILKKYVPACLFCGNADDVIMYKSKLVCKHCLEEMSRQAN